MKLSGIYCIQCKRGFKYYGSAGNIKQRWRQHKYELRHGTHGNPKLQRAWNKYGEDFFSFSVVEIVKDTTILIEREQFWIDGLFASNQYHYNSRRTADSNRGTKRTEESRRKMSEKKKGRPVSLAAKIALEKAMTPERIRENALKQSGGKIYTFSDKYGNIYDGIVNLTDFARTNNVLRTDIIALSNGKGITRCDGFYLVDINIDENFATDKSREQVDNVKRILEDRTKPKTVYVFTDRHNNLYEFSVIAHFAKQYNLNATHISSVIQGERKQHKGFSLVEIKKAA